MNGFGGSRRLTVLVVVIVALVLLYAVSDSIFGYVWYRIGPNEVGVMFNASQPYRVVGPGVWSNPGLWQDIKPIKIEGIPFTIHDPEVLTKDQQRLGVEVAGTVHRPGLDKTDIIISQWSSYSNFYLIDETLTGPPGNPELGLMSNLGKQAAKVCVGDLAFNDAVVGSARDVLRECIDTELDNLARGYGLEVRNVVVPEITMSPAVQAKMDEITDARFATQVAQQEEQRARAEAARQLAVEQGQIQVEQGRVQEKAKQDRITAELDRQVQEAQFAVIEAEKRNELLAIEKDLEIARVNRDVAEEQARAQLARETALAALYGQNPAYVDLLKVQAMSAAYSEMDKILMLPDTVNPYLFLGGQEQTPPLSIPLGE